MNNIFVVKTIPEEPSKKEKYKDAHVWDIFWQCKRFFNKPFRFYLLTNFTTVNHPEIRIIDVAQHRYDGWWNKMLLFHPEVDKEGTNLYFDLDVTFHREITDITKYIFPGLLTCVYCYWKPIDWLDLSKQEKVVQDDPDMKFPSFYNTSVMGWEGGTLSNVWREFYEDDQFNITLYRGNDDYLGHQHLNICHSYVFPSCILS